MTDNDPVQPLLDDWTKLREEKKALPYCWKIGAKYFWWDNDTGFQNSLGYPTPLSEVRQALIDNKGDFRSIN